MKAKRVKEDNKHNFNYEWNLADGYPAPGIKKNGLKVFSCFACGGGSTMGYKLAGYDVIGANEIDPKMAEAYKVNHSPKYLFIEDIRKFKERTDLPEELFNLDILDGSPPCSSFSMAGNRAKDWGKKKKFKEGQAEQILDNLFFEFIELADKLRPRVVIAENVKGLLQGEAQKYVNKINIAFDRAGYIVQHWLLNGADMGVPQKRERLFFIAMRKDIAGPLLYRKDLFSYVPKLDLKFNKRKVIFSEIIDNDDKKKKLTKLDKFLWDRRTIKDIDLCDINQRERGKISRFNAKFLFNHKVSNTIMAADQCILFNYPRRRNKKELLLCGSYPTDYNFLKNKPEYLIGMSVPPVMVAQIANEVFKQWFSKI